MPDQPTPPPWAEPAIKIEQVDRDAFFIVATGQPEIPDGAGRICPQCAKTAWARSRWCWHCKFDFDRASLPRFHLAKLLTVSLVFNVAAVLTIGIAAITAHCP